eukprot:16364741-Heterocapsa_arctica.AAC.1
MPTTTTTTTTTTTIHSSSSSNSSSSSTTTTTITKYSKSRHAPPQRAAPGARPLDLHRPPYYS